MNPLNIKSKIVRVILAILSLALLAAIIFLSIFINNKISAKEKDNFLVNSEEQMEKVDILFSMQETEAKNLASNHILIDWLTQAGPKDPSVILPILNDFNIEKGYSNVFILSLKGDNIAATDPSLLGQNYAFRDYFKDAIKSPSGFQVAIGVSTKQPGYYFSAPIKDGSGKVLGVAVIKLPASALEKVVRDAALEDNPLNQGQVMMLSDKHGVVFYSSDSALTYKSLGIITPANLADIKDQQLFPGINIAPLAYDNVQADIVSGIKQGRLETGYNPDTKKSELIAVIPFGNFPLFLAIKADAANFYQNATYIYSIVIAIVIVFTILTALTIMYFAIRFLRPFKVLKSMAEEIGHGNFDQENKIHTHDEFEDLGNTVATIGKQLKNNYVDLENSVKGKTEELLENNRNLEYTQKAVLNILEDVEHEKIKSELLAKDLEKFKLALDSTSDHINISDREGIVIYANKGSEKITGYSVKDIVGKKAGALWKLPMPKEYYEDMWKTIKTDKKVFDGRLKNRRKNGEIYDAHITIAPILDKGKEVEFFVAIEHDVTKELEVDRAKTEFVSLASHQLRTPLSSINWYAEMLLAGDAGPLTEEQKGFVEEVYKGNQRMVGLVNSLLNVSRLELGTFVVEPEPTNVVELARGVLDELTPSITKKEIAIDFRFDESLPVINTDPKLLRIIFQNLLSNAVKYTPERGRITVNLNKDTKNLLISVSDNGYGIPDNQKSKIFSKLFRADNAREKDTEGTGLGLYIIKSILDNTQGNVRFESQENKGTTFFVETPLNGMSKKEGTKSIE
jgi:PAS domain S-box-containing protein